MTCKLHASCPDSMLLKVTLLLLATQNFHCLHSRHVSVYAPSLQCCQAAACLHLCIQLLPVCACTGGGSIDTSTVTTTPYVLHYTAEDALGNIAVPVSRTVSVYNPCTPQAYCTASGELLSLAVWTTTHV